MSKTVTLVRKATAEDKIAPQARVICEILENKFGVGKATEREKIGEALSADEKFVTRQDPLRVLSFYQPKLIELGLIKIESPAKAEKPAKEAKDGKAAAPAANKAATAKAPVEAAKG